jgi:hypothetical protein
MDPVATEVELLHCEYAARCTRVRCPQYRATTIVRYLDSQGRALRQLEFCDWHAGVIALRERRAGRRVRDLRRSP